MEPSSDGTKSSSDTISMSEMSSILRSVTATPWGSCQMEERHVPKSWELVDLIAFILLICTLWHELFIISHSRFLTDPSLPRLQHGVEYISSGHDRVDNLFVDCEEQS